MDDEMNGIDLQIETAHWMSNEAEKLIKEYKGCRTAHARVLLRPKLEAIRATLQREEKAMRPMIDFIKKMESEGEEWKNDTTV